MNANPLNYVRGLVAAIAGAERELKAVLVKDLAAWLPELRDFAVSEEHAVLKDETVAAAEALLPKAAAK